MIQPNAQFKPNLNYHYDPAYDSLNIYLGKANRFYSDEMIKGIFCIYDEDTEELIGVEINYFSKWNKEYLRMKLPIEFDYSNIN